MIGNTPVVCGGGFTDECYSMTQRTATLITKMSVKRRDAASIVLNETVLWVSGGMESWDVTHGTSDYVTLNSSSPGPDLPFPLDSHKMISINTTHTMMVGGINDDWPATVLDLTFYFDHEKQNWGDGPVLNQKRYSHVCGSIVDEFNMQKVFVVAGGFNDIEKLSSTEILVKDQWLQGMYLLF